MKKITLSILVLSFIASCNKNDDSNEESLIQINSSLGCIDEMSSQIIDIPYATTTTDFGNGITIEDGFEDYDLGFYDDNRMPIFPRYLESNQFLGISLKNTNEPIKLYKLFKQPLTNEIIVNGEEVRISNPIFCKSRISNKSTAQTWFFNATKDST